LGKFVGEKMLNLVTTYLKSSVILLCLAFLYNPLYSQELFISTEPASTMPKGVFGYRIFGNSYSEQGTQRNMLATRVQYGLTATTTLKLTASFANHHGKILPPDLINHSHNGSQTVYGVQNIKRGVTYPYLFNGLNLMLKQRIYSWDDQKRHFRVAAMATYSNVKSAHDEAEANLLHDTKGWSLALSTTYLHKRFAVSTEIGYVKPGVYKEQSTVGEFFPEERSIEMHYGAMWSGNLALGYLLYPKTYSSYAQSNWNVYAEFLFRKYDAVHIIYNGQEVEDTNQSTSAGFYVDIQPGVQKIINSTARVELSVAFPLIRKSFSHFYPVYNLAYQRFIFKQKPIIKPLKP